MIRSVRIGLRLWGIAEEPFWPARERLLDLAHLGALQVADLGREALEAAAGDRDPRGQHRVAVARDRPGWRRPRAAARAAPSPAPRPRAAPRRRCRPRRRACRRRAARRRRSSRCEVAVGLEGEAGEAQAEGRRLGVDAVGAADAERVAVLERPLDQRVAVGAGAGQHDLARLAQLQRQRRVEHVGGGQAVVDPAPVLADRRGDDVDEGGDVVVGDPLALLDRLDREGGVRPRRLGGLRRARRPPRPRPRSPPARPRASTPSCAAATRPRRSPGRV